MLDLQQLETFAKVVEYGHFRKAAAALSISPGAVSQRIKALESFIGALLLIREPVISPTKAGEEVLRYITSLRVQESELLQHITPGRFSPAEFSVAVNADSFATWFEPVAKQLARGTLALEIVVDDQDHTLGALARGEVRGCISTQREPLTGFLAESVGQMSYQCVATPRFADELSKCWTQLWRSTWEPVCGTLTPALRMK